MNDLFKEAIKVLLKIKKIIFFIAILYVLSFFIGFLLIAIENPFAIQFKNFIIEFISTYQPFSYVLEALKSGNILQAIIFTFLYNLISGAFLSTTLPGLLPFIGAIFISLVTFLRGLMIGITYYEIFENFNLLTIVALGTLFLELSAYVFSASAGINISLSIIFPEKYSINKFEAFKKSIKDALKIYLIVIILLIFGAMWEMIGIFLVVFLNNFFIFFFFDSFI
jgi:hypothetical protein